MCDVKEIIYRQDFFNSMALSVTEQKEKKEIVGKNPKWHIY
jgi:hypothetical protein